MRKTRAWEGLCVEVMVFLLIFSLPAGRQVWFPDVPGQAFLLDQAKRNEYKVEIRGEVRGDFYGLIENFISNQSSLAV